MTRRDLVRVHRGLYLRTEDASDQGDATRRISILDARGTKVGYHTWDSLSGGRLRLVGRSVSAGEEASVDKAIGKLHTTSRMVAMADCCLFGADRSQGSDATGLMAIAALETAAMPGFPADVADAVTDRVLALCAQWPTSSWAMGVLARLGQAA